VQKDVDESAGEEETKEEEEEEEEEEEDKMRLMAAGLLGRLRGEVFVF
jgi:hypothetical protein